MNGKRSRHFITQPNDFEYTRYMLLILDILREILGIFAMSDPDFRYGVAAVIQTLR